jgi:hypothetical protein
VYLSGDSGKECRLQNLADYIKDEKPKAGMPAMMSGDLIFPVRGRPIQIVMTCFDCGYTVVKELGIVEKKTS